MSFQLKYKSLLQCLPSVKIILRNTTTKVTTSNNEETLEPKSNNPIVIMPYNPKFQMKLDDLHRGLKVACYNFVELDKRSNQAHMQDKKKADMMHHWYKTSMAIQILKLYPTIKLNDVTLINAITAPHEIVTTLGEVQIILDSLTAANDNNC